MKFGVFLVVLLSLVQNILCDCAHSSACATLYAVELYTWVSMHGCMCTLPFSMIIRDHSPHVVSNPSIHFLNRLLCAWSQGVGAYPSEHFHKNIFYRADCGLWEDRGNRKSTQNGLSWSVDFNSGPSLVDFIKYTGKECIGMVCTTVHSQL